MEALASSEVFLFEDFRLDRRGGGLFRRDGNGGLVPVALGSRGLDILGVLIKRAGEVVSKDEIIATVWPGMVVEDSNLTVQISALRRVLDRGRSRGSCIQTVPGRGYRFVVPGVQPVAESASTPPPVNNAGVASRAIDVSVRRQLPRSLQRIGSTRRLAAILTPAVAAVVGAVLVLAVSAWSLWPAAKPSSTPEMLATTSISQPIVAPRLSIVVLPFTNLSDDPDQQYFADGLTDDLTTDLSRIPDMFVIARNTGFTYRNKLTEAKQIGRELGVRYLLEGSVQRSGGEVRVNAQLIDAETDAHMWAERFERDARDLFALQNEITTRISIALSQELPVAEAARRIERPDVLDYILRFRAILVNTPPGTPGVKAARFLEQALALDPQSAEAQSWLAYVLAGRVLANMTDSPTVDLERAKALSEQAVVASPRSQLAHVAKGQVLRAQRRYAEAIPEYETVLALDRNWVFAYFALGQCKFHTGSIEEAIPLIERAIRLSPRDPQLGVWYQMIGDVHLLQSHTNEAVMWLEKARNHTPAHSMIRADLAAAYGLADETERAATELAEARRLSPDDRYSSLARLRRIENWGAPKIRALREATKFAGLRKAGMPEE